MNTTLRTWNPWHELNQLSNQFEQVFARQWPAVSKQNHSKFGAVNLLQGKEDLLLQAVLPGYELSDFDISLTKNSVTLKANQKAETAQSGVSSRTERAHRQFAKSISLPVEIDPSNCEATYGNGILTLKLLQPPEQQPQKIEVKSI